MDGITAALTLAAIVLVAVRWNRIPKRIPMNYSFDGQITSYGGKGSLILLLVILIAEAVGLTLVIRFPKCWNLPCTVTDNNRYIVYRTTKTWISIVRIILLLAIFLLLVYSVCGRKLPAWYTPVELILIFGVIIAGLVVICVRGAKYR